MTVAMSRIIRNLSLPLLVCLPLWRLEAAELQLEQMSETAFRDLKTRVEREAQRRSPRIPLAKSKSNPQSDRSLLPFDDPNFRARGIENIEYDKSYSLEKAWRDKSDKIQDFYLRNDSLDSFAYLFPFALLDGRGASLSYTNNQLNDSQTLQVKGFGSYVVHRDISKVIPEDPNQLRVGGTAVAAYVAADGTLGQPFRRSERNALQFGLDSQASAFSGGFLPIQNFGLRPYYQTDFRFEGSIYGFSALYEPYAPSANIGTRIIEPQFLGVLFRALPEFNYFYVDDPGRTNFLPNTHHAWLGGTLQARAVLFEEMEEVPEVLRDRIYLNASVTKFWNLAATGGDFHDAQIEAGYLLTRPKSAEGPFPTASVSFLYNNGRSRLTFDQREQYRVQLNVQY